MPRTAATYPQKQRDTSGSGHLSNRQQPNFANYSSKPVHMALPSQRNNNHPELAYQTVEKQSPGKA